MKSVKIPVYFDSADRKILQELQKNGRESLTNIAKKINVAIDTVKSRIERLEQEGIILEIRPYLNPRAMGYPLVADIKIKLHNNTEQHTEEFLAFLLKHPRVIEVVTLMGDYDMTCILIAKNTDDLGEVSRIIRQKFNSIIADWRGFLTLKVHKFDSYDLGQL